MVEECETDSCIRGYHVYQDRWLPIIGERLECRRETGNPRDAYAVAMWKGDEIVGHVPRYISALCSLFIRHGGAVYSIVLGERRYSRDLPQGGMEIPCRLHFVGNGRELKKVKSFLKAIPTIPGAQCVSVNNNQPVMNSDQPVMNSDQPVMNSDQPVMNSDQPVMNSDQPVMNSDQPVMNSDQPVMNSDQPVMNSDQPVMNSDQPVMNSDQPVMNSDQPVMNSDQPVMNSDQPVMNSDQPVMNSDQPVMNSDQPATNSQQLGESNMNYGYAVVDCDQLSPSKQESPQHIASSAMVLKQPLLDSNKKQVQTFLNDGTLKSSKSTIQLSNPPPEQSAVWTTFERCVFQVSDKVLIENGAELTDKHMQFAQCMIKKQFPSVGGLNSTLLQDKPPSLGSRTANTIQIVHCKKRRHWITVSTKWCQGDHVAVYDSVFVRLDAETRTTIMKMFRLKKTKDIIMMPMHKQYGSTDCGVFAIAVLTSLAHEEDPSKFKQN